MKAFSNSSKLQNAYERESLKAAANGSEDEQAVFFDYLSWFRVFYSRRAAVVLHSIPIAIFRSYWLRSCFATFCDFIKEFRRLSTIFGDYHQLPAPVTDFRQGKKSNKSRTVIIIVVPTVTSVIIIVCICIFLRARKPREKDETMDEIKCVDSLQFDFGTIRVAADNFSDANKLGQGGFGAVYKISLQGRLSSGQDIAVKMLLMNSEQGEQ